MLKFGDKNTKIKFNPQLNPRIILLFTLIKKLVQSTSVSKLINICRYAELLKIFTFVSILSVCSAHVVMGEQCDWTGSGLGRRTGEMRGITPVYLRCSQGRVSWVYPRNGLRVLLRLGSTGKDFKGCIKVNPSFAGARIFLEDRKSLKELYSPDDNFPVKLARCFHSQNEQAALYIEAAAPSSATVFPKYLAEFSYDLELVRPNFYDLEEKCKPCDQKELMHAFCTNDLVVSGLIEAIHQEEDMDESEIIIRPDKFLKYSSFEMKYITKNDVNSDENDIYPSISVMISRTCQSKPGTGQFVFMARKRFDDYSLVCAPRWDDWKQLVKDEKPKGNSHCVLSY